MAFVLWCFNICITQLKRLSWGKTRSFKKESQKEPCTKLQGVLPSICMEKNYSGGREYEFSHFPTLPSFSFLMLILFVSQTSGSVGVVGVTGFWEGGMDKDGYWLKTEPVGSTGISRFPSLNPALSANHASALINWHGKGFKRHGGVTDSTCTLIGWLLENHATYLMF